MERSIRGPLALSVRPGSAGRLKRMSDSPDVEQLRRIFAEEHLWDEILVDADFWRNVIQLPSHEQAKVCIARVEALGITEPEAATNIRIAQMGLVAALIAKLGDVDSALAMLKPKQH